MGAKEEPEGAEDEQADEAGPAPHMRLAASPRPIAPAQLPPEDVRRLRATLETLEACRKLLDSALTE